jgi:glycosyltransferase involved in cell wall biosynthesis
MSSLEENYLNALQLLFIMKIIVSIPAFNEENTLGSVLDEIHTVMKMHKYAYKVLVLNDGSVDRTAEVAKKHGAVVVSNKRNRGLAFTFAREMEECLRLKADVIVHTDADGQYFAEDIPRLLEKINQGFDLVLGSRFVSKGYSGSFMKSLGNKAFAFTFSWLMKTKITDTTTGFRAFTADIAEMRFINSFTYTQEQLIRAHRRRFRVAEIPISTRKTRPSKLFSSPFQYAVKAWVNILRIYRDFAPLTFFGLIGGGMLAIGSVLGLFIIYNIFQTGFAGGIPRVILSALLILTGLQVILFGFFADMLRPS